MRCIKRLSIICSMFMFVLSYSMNEPVDSDHNFIFVTIVTTWKYQTARKTLMFKSDYSKSPLATALCIIPYEEPTVSLAIIGEIAAISNQCHDMCEDAYMSRVAEHVLLGLINQGRTCVLAHQRIQELLHHLKFRSLEVTSKPLQASSDYLVSIVKRSSPPPLPDRGLVRSPSSLLLANSETST